MRRIARAPSSACSTRPTTPTARPGTFPARRPERPASILALGAAAIGVAPRAIGLPPALLRPLGLFVPPLRELAEMRFQWDRPYRVDSSRFAKRFWADATPFEVGAPATALWFRDHARAP